LVVLQVVRDAHRSQDAGARPFDDTHRRHVAGVAAAENPNRTVAVVRDGNLVPIAIDVDRHRPVEAGLLALYPADRRDVAFRVRVVGRDRRLVETAAGGRGRLGPWAAALSRRRVTRRRLAPALIAVVRDDDLVVPAVEEHAVRIAEAGLRPADHAQRLLASFGLLPVDHDLAR